jgi:hypothetical protein
MVTSPRRQGDGRCVAGLVDRVRRELGARLRSGALFLLLVLGAGLPPARGQTNPPPPAQDPLMALMLSQPKILTGGPFLATASFDPPVVGAGGLAFYRVTLNALEESIDWPAGLAGPAGLEWRAGARGQILQMVGTNLEPRTTYSYRVRAPATGEFTVPEFEVRVADATVPVPAATLSVVPHPPAGTAQQLVVEISRTNLFVGQSAEVRVLSRGSPSGVIQPLQQVQLVGPGVLVDLAAGRQRIEHLTQNGVNVPTYIYETTLTPMQAGRLDVFAQAFTAGLALSAPLVIKGPATIAAGPLHYLLLESDRVGLQARPLPSEGELPGFTGAIGSLALDPPTLTTNGLRVGDPVGLSVTVRGDRSLSRLVAPPPPQRSDWQIVRAATDFGPAAAAIPRPQNLPVGPAHAPELPGAATFHYTLIPQTDQVQATPPIPFAFFDPEREAYVDLTIPALPVTVQPGLVAAELPAAASGRAGATSDQEPVLSSLAAAPGRTSWGLVPWQERAWFPLMQFAPAAMFLGLWWWDRRRRYLEQHPEILVRRRARRALRRERRVLEAAARAGDARRFAAAAVTALRVASAPHYRAESQALVGSDVLPLLPQLDCGPRSNEIVRRFFAVTDAARFATEPGEATELLALRPELESLLEKLEAKL